MKETTVDEFRDHALQYVSGRVPIAVVDHGCTLGYYIPAAARRDDPAIAHLAETVRRMMAETGLTEDELARDFGDFPS